MDAYHAIHGHDVSSFDLASTHRLPTVSAARVYEDLSGNPSRFVSTGLAVLNSSLAASVEGLEHGLGGVQRGIVTEVWGPPGVGKTTLGLQLAANAVGDGQAVVWVDGFHNICPKRLTAIVGDEAHPEGAVSRLTHFACPTLAHLVALLCRPNAACIPPNTSLVVVDSLSALLNHAFPRTAETKGGRGGGGGGPGMHSGNKGPSFAARRLQTLQYILSALQKLAATCNLAVVILTQCATKMQGERGASLIPAVAATAWDDGISDRIVLFRDWCLQNGSPTASRFAAVLKLNGKRVDERDIELAAFHIGTTGLLALTPDPSLREQSQSAHKRKLRDTGLEIPDSDDEDYGWQLEDEDALPGMPPQWQGSEDILLGRDPETDVDSGSDHGDGDPHAEVEAEAEADAEASSDDQTVCVVGGRVDDAAPTAT